MGASLMQWCQLHWDGLRAEVERQGASSLVPETGEEAMSAFVRQLEGEDSVDAFDPLMGAMWAINHYIGEALGPGGHLTVIVYDGCPVCKFNEMHKEGCVGPDCPMDKQLGVVTFFPNAVSDQITHWKKLRS